MYVTLITLLAGFHIVTSVIMDKQNLKFLSLEDPTVYSFKNAYKNNAILVKTTTENLEKQ